MFLSNPAKSFFASVLIFVFTVCCGFRQNDRTESTPLISETKPQIPFSTKEPDVFQCEIVVTTGETVRKTFVARKSEKSRIDYDYGEENQHAVLRNEKEYLIAFKRKIYTENSPISILNTSEIQFSDITSELLSRGDHVEFIEIASENNLLKYKVQNNESNTSEVFIYMDQRIGLPVKQEFFSVKGEERILRYSVELRNFTPDAQESLFEIPKGFRKVSLEEFYRTLR